MVSRTVRTFFTNIFKAYVMNPYCSSSKLVTSSLEVSEFSLSLTSSRGRHVVSMEFFQVREKELCASLVQQHIAPDVFLSPTLSLVTGMGHLLSSLPSSFVLIGERNINKVTREQTRQKGRSISCVNVPPRQEESHPPKHHLEKPNIRCKILLDHHMHMLYDFFENPFSLFCSPCYLPRWRRWAETVST